MDERMTRGVQPGQALTVAEKVTAVDVDRGIAQSLNTGVSNQYAMTFEQQDDQGRKQVSPYVKKAGRSLKLNEAATKKGGLALLRSICVRSSWETPEQMQQMYQMLPDDLKRKFLESRGGDYRVFTAPAGRAIYLFIVLFKSGEKWMGEGIAYVGNTKNPKMHVRLDELAETRSFNRCVGRGLADGFINADQVAGSDADDDDLHGEFDDDELLDDADQDVAATVAPVVASQGKPAEPPDPSPLWMPAEADPDGSGPFRSPERGGSGGAGAGGAGGGGAAPGPGTETGSAPAGESESVPAGGGAGDQRHGADRSEDGGQPQDYTIEELMTMASERGVFLLRRAKDRFSVDRLTSLDADQRVALYIELSEKPVKGANT